ncbi:hypothetical protein N7460_002483, partial [Penicillium canescens]
MASDSSHQSLVKGGYAQQGSLPSIFFSSAPPFISEFYAFNSLLKGLGLQKTYLTAADPQRLVNKYGTFLSGNPYEDRKECLSHELLDKGELTPVTVVRSAHMIDQFLGKASRASELAKKINTPLLLLTFCHCLTMVTSVKASMVWLKGVLNLGVRVSLITTACYSGDWGESQSIGRSCGSVFATTLLESLSSAATPLRHEPNEVQAITYNAFCHSVWKTCEHRVTRLWNDQGETQDDYLELLMDGQNWIPSRRLSATMEFLTSHLYAGPNN